MRDRVVTARVTTLKGPDAGGYYIEAIGAYYLDGDEPPGTWRGTAARALGLSGELAEDDFLALMAGLDPRTGTSIGTRHAERTVRGFDVTCSAPKSLSVLYVVGDGHVRSEVLAAHDAAVDAVVDWIEQHAHCRHRVNGDIWTVDAQGITAALFRQHTSREHDPQIHTHMVIPNRVLAPDGRWLALDARTLKKDQRTLSALYHAGLRAELTQRLGVRWLEPKDGIAEMADIDPKILEAFSNRTKAVETLLDRKIDRFVDALGRQPTPRERGRLEREAVLQSRPTKTGADALTLHQDWADRLLPLGVDPYRLVHDTVNRVQPVQPDLFGAGHIEEQAVDALSEQQSTWRSAEITREVARAVPSTTSSTAADVVAWVDEMSAAVETDLVVDLSLPVPSGVPLRRDGRPVTEPAVNRVLTTAAILAQENEIISRAQLRIDRGGENRGMQRSGLAGVQHEVAAAVAGTRHLVLVVGPAGTGKTTALRPAVTQLRRDGRPVFGVTPSATAADVLATETGVDADTLDKLLIEHRVDRPPDPRYALPAGTTLIVDEAAMVATPKLRDLFDLADRQRWRLCLVGDPLQFAAVGRSGMFDHLIDTFGAIELDRVHRFTEPWERQASLALRRGDTDIVQRYEEHGRLHGGTASQMRHAVLLAWWDAEQAGQTAAMMAPTRDAVIRLNQIAQAWRLADRLLDTGEPTVTVGPYTLYEGDVIATRRNDRCLRTDQGHWVRNRDHWTVETVHPDGALTVSGRTGRIRLDSDYVAGNIELAYAETSHANQGRTVDRSFLYLDAPTDTRGIYVPLTRGRHTNQAFVVTEADQTAADIITEAVARTWIDTPAITHLTPGRSGISQDRSRQHDIGPSTLTGHQLAAAMEREQRLVRELARGGISPAEHETTLTSLAALSLQRERDLDRIDRARADMTAALAVLDHNPRGIDRLLHRTQVAQAEQAIEDSRTALKSLRANVIKTEARTTEIQDSLDVRLTREALRPGLEQSLHQVRTELVTDHQARVTDLAVDELAVIVDRLGREPAEETEKQLWREAAGLIAQHRAAHHIPDGTLLGYPLSYNDPDAYIASYQAATQAIHHLDHALGRTSQRTLEKEPPGLSL